MILDLPTLQIIMQAAEAPDVEPDRSALRLDGIAVGACNLCGRKSTVRGAIGLVCGFLVQSDNKPPRACRGVIVECEPADDQRRGTV